MENPSASAERLKALTEVKVGVADVAIEIDPAPLLIPMFDPAVNVAS
jgi:hypothetical protein